MELSRGTKKILMTVEILFTVILLITLVFEIIVPRYTQEEVIHYSYESRGSIDYSVYLRPNSMFDERSLEKDLYYVLKYIDYIDLEFDYEYTSDLPADLEIQYSVMAYLQGLHGRDEEILWSREYPLVPSGKEREEGLGLEIQKGFSLHLDEYTRLAENIFLDSEVNAPVVLRVEFNIHTAIDTEHGMIEDDISPTITIPIGNNVFKIEGEPVVTGQNSIAKTEKVRIPINIRNVIMSSIGLLILGLLLLFTGSIEEMSPPDEFRREINNIFKEYSERLAGLEHTLLYQASENITINSIEDMVKIADEIGQPIFYYEVDSSIERKIEFFVFDNMRTYYMVIFGEIEAGIEL